MYYKYYISLTIKNPSNNHEVHREDCYYLPAESNRSYLGLFTNCREAVLKAKRDGYTNVDGCKSCCPDCHRA
ncbi:MAG: hypothetical protein ACRDDZ_08735 [Marinifilaceae bacterium]